MGYSADSAASCAPACWPLSTASAAAAAAANDDDDDYDDDAAAAAERSPLACVLCLLLVLPLFARDATAT